MSRIGAAFGIGDRGGEEPAPDIAKAVAIPSTTLGTSMSSADDIGGVAYAGERRLNLLGQQRFDVYEEMVRDVAIIAAGVRLFLNLLSNAEWTVNPPENLTDNEAAVAQGYADTAYDILFDMTSSWSSVVRKLSGSRLQGFALMEWTAKRRPDGVIGLLDIEHRPQRTIAKWVRDPSGTITAVVQRVSGRGDIPLPRAKLVYAVDDTLTDSPEGMGLFRHLAATAERLKTFLELEEIGFTTDLRGIPIARAPLGELKAQAEAAGDPKSESRKQAEATRNAMLRPLRDFIEKHVRNKSTGILLPSDTFQSKSTDNATTPTAVPKWALELLNGSSNSFEEIADAINRMNQELARILGVEHLLLGSDGGGSLALARSKVGTFYLTVTSTLLDLVEVIDRDILEPLAELNGWEEHLRPQMGVNEISDRDIEQVMEALAKLAQAGAPLLSSDPAVGEIYDMLGLSRPPVDEDADTDVSLNPRRNEPADPVDALPDNPETVVNKRRVIRSSRARRNRRK